VLITGGVHGYETSGVHGALQFVDQRAEDYAGRVNLLVAPVRDRALMHMDLHETTDTDESEFRPATASRSSRVRFPMAFIWLMTGRTLILNFSRR